MKDNVKTSKQVVKNTMMLYIRQFFILFLNLYTVRQVLIVLGENDYGIYTVVAGIVAMFSTLSGTMSGACQRFFSYDLGREDYEKLNTNFSMALIIHLIIGVIVVLLTETIGLWYVVNKLSISDGRYNAAIFVYQTAITVLIMTIINTPYIAIVLANEDMNIYAIISIIEAVLKFLSIIIISYCHGDRLVLYGVSFIIVEVVVVSSYYIVRKLKYIKLKIVRNFNKKLFKELSSFAGWNLLGNLIYPLKVQGVNIIYNQIFGTKVISGRGIAASVNSAVTSFYINFSNAIKPQIVKRYASDGYNGVRNIVYAGAKLTYLLMFAIMFPLIVEMEFVLGLWLGNIPQYAVIFSQLSLIEALIDAVSNPLNTLVDATGNNKKYQLITCGIQLCNLPLTIHLVHYIDNPVLSYVIAIILTLVSTIARIIISSELTGLEKKDFVFNVVCKVIFASIIPIVFVVCIKKLLMIEGLMVIPIYIVFEVILLVVFYMICFDRNEKFFLRSIVDIKTKPENL